MTTTRAERRRPAFVASTGGHLVQLYLMASVLEPERHRDGLWITNRTPQSESMLRDERVIFIDPVDTRDWAAAIRRTPTILRALRRHHVDAVYSTGAAVAVSTLPGARLVGARPRYIESLARSTGPSVAGRALQWIPWVPVYTQYPQNASWRWRYEHSLLDSFTVDASAEAPAPQRIFVTLGTTRFPFRRLVERVLEIAPPSAQIVWQTGVTDVGGLDIDVSPMMSDADFRAEIARADVVVSHAGCGTFIRCLEAGKVPLLVPRRAAHGEHVDDHQEQIASVGQGRGLALMREVGELSLTDLRTAMSLHATHVDATAPVSPTR